MSEHDIKPLSLAELVKMQQERMRENAPPMNFGSKEEDDSSSSTTARELLSML